MIPWGLLPVGILAGFMGGLAFGLALSGFTGDAEELADWAAGIRDGWRGR